MNMKQPALTFLPVFLLTVHLGLAGLSAQTPAVPAPASQLGFAFEFQAYPTGLIPGVRADYFFGARHSLSARAGYNWVRHGDQGVQDNEWGDGFGGSLGYRYFFRVGWTNWFLGARSDVWANRMHWEDKDANGQVTGSGLSKIVVVQPTAEGGYLFPLGKNGWFIAPSVAFGVEINVKTTGADVGEGAIFLLGFSVGKFLHFTF